MKTSLDANATYEDQLAHDSEWAMDEGERFFNEQSAVHRSLKKVTRRLAELEIPYAVVGGMALFKHGLRRFTEDVDILVSGASLTAIHEQLEGRGFVRPFSKSKNLRDTEHRVKIEFLVEGQFPGDGKPKPVAFPNPDAVSVELDGIKYVNLPTLVELKLASGMSNPDRFKDLADVYELIKTIHLPLSLQESLNPYVRGKYDEIWTSIRAVSKRFIKLWNHKALGLEATSLDELAKTLQSAADELNAMQSAGVLLEQQGGVAGEYAVLVTTDPDVARRFEMVEESEYWGMGEPESRSEPPDA